MLRRLETQAGMASIAAATGKPMSAAAAASYSNIDKLSSASSFTRGNRAQFVRSDVLFLPLVAGACGRYQVRNCENSSRLSRRKVGESWGLGSDGGCQFGGAGTGIVPGEARRRMSLSFSVVTHAGKGDSVPAAERILASLGYVLPFFDGIQYGRYFFMQFPIAETLLRPLFPLLSAYKGFPYSNFIAFFSLYLLVVRNSSFSRYVRFNAMQAVVLDVLLILPTLVERTFGPRGGIGLQLLIIFYNTVFLFLVSCFLFGTISCLLGKTPRLPIVADAADAQVEG